MTLHEIDGISSDPPVDRSCVLPGSSSRGQAETEPRSRVPFRSIHALRGVVLLYEERAKPRRWSGLDGNLPSRRAGPLEHSVAGHGPRDEEALRDVASDVAQERQRALVLDALRD